MSIFENWRGDRRDFLRETFKFGTIVAGTPLLTPVISCNFGSDSRDPQSAPLPATTEITAGIRRETGEWTQSEVETLARVMMKETQLNDEAFAGAVLLDNQTGKPSFSRMSSAFADSKVKIRTINDIDPSGAGMGIPAVMKARIYEDEQRLVFSIRERNTGNTRAVSASVALHLGEIQLNKTITNKYSDFLTAFLFTKEVLNVTAYDMASSYLTANALYTQYEAPQDPRFKNALKVSTIKGYFGDVPASAMADMWAHFLLVPNYLLAIDQNKFSKEELQDNVMRVFKYPSEVFQESGVLTKNKNGGYDWTKDPEKFFTIWINLGTAAFEAFKKK